MKKHFPDGKHLSRIDLAAIGVYTNKEEKSIKIEDQVFLGDFLIVQFENNLFKLKLVNDNDLIFITAMQAAVLSIFLQEHTRVIASVDLDTLNIEQGLNYLKIGDCSFENDFLMISKGLHGDTVKFKMIQDEENIMSISGEQAAVLQTYFDEILK